MKLIIDTTQQTVELPVQPEFYGNTLTDTLTLLGITHYKIIVTTPTYTPYVPYVSYNPLIPPYTVTC